MLYVLIEEVVEEADESLEGSVGAVRKALTMAIRQRVRQSANRHLLPLLLLLGCMLAVLPKVLGCGTCMGLDKRRGAYVGKFGEASRAVERCILPRSCARAANLAFWLYKMTWLVTMLLVCYESNTTHACQLSMTSTHDGP